MALVFLFSLLLYSCNFKNKIDGVFTSKTDTTVDNQRAVEKSIAAKDGGDITLESADGVQMNIIFPQNSLEKDAVVTAAPISQTSSGNEGAPNTGFSLEEKGTGHGPSMQYPAIVVFNVNREMDKNSSILRNHDADDGFDVIPTDVVVRNGKTMMTALADHFTVFRINAGSKDSAKVTDQIKEKAKKEQEEQLRKNYHLVIVVDDKQFPAKGARPKGVKGQDIPTTIHLRAENVLPTILPDGVSKGGPGYIAGHYKGKATMTFQDAGGGVWGKATYTADDAQFDIYPYDPETFASDWNTTPEEAADPLAQRLLNLGDAKFIGQGIFLLNVIRGEGGIGGERVEKDFPAAKIKCRYIIRGLNVDLYVEFPASQLLFHGFIRYEGNK